MDEMNAIFIVGTGRSGTHFLTRLLLGFRNTWDPLGGREDPKRLNALAKAAIHHDRLPDWVLADYQAQASAGSGVYLCQDHPNVFFADRIAAAKHGAVFLYTDRPTHQVVASMMRHHGVMAWYDYARSWRRRYLHQVPFPNRFLGLEVRSQIWDLPMHLLCAKRVISHRQAFQKIAQQLGGERVRRVDYVDLVRSPEAELSRIFNASEHARLGEFIPTETPHTASLEKYRDVLSEAEVVEIAALENETASN